MTTPMTTMVLLKTGEKVPRKVPGILKGNGSGTSANFVKRIVCVGTGTVVAEFALLIDQIQRD